MAKKLPMRQCVGCGEMKGKKEMMRVLKAEDSVICLDLTGKKSGRGAYICKDVECFNKARKARRFEKSFSCRIDSQVYEVMENELTAENS